MTVLTNNPAGRLYQLLRELQELGGFGRSNFLKVFDLEDSVDADFQALCKVLETLKLVDDTEEALMEIDDGADVTFFLTTLPDIRRVLKEESIKAIDRGWTIEHAINVHLINMVGRKPVAVSGVRNRVSEHSHSNALHSEELACDFEITRSEL